jgi:hypothetical protein
LGVSGKMGEGDAGKKEASRKPVTIAAPRFVEKAAVRAVPAGLTE